MCNFKFSILFNVKSGFCFKSFLLNNLFSIKIDKQLFFFANSISISLSPTYHIFLLDFKENLFNASTRGYLEGLSFFASLAPTITLKYFFHSSLLISLRNKFPSLLLMTPHLIFFSFIFFRIFKALGIGLIFLR